MSGPCDSAATASRNVLIGGLQPGQPAVGGAGGGLVPGSFQPARVPVCRLTLSAVQYLTGTQQPIPASPNVDQVLFDTATFDPFGLADLVNGWIEIGMDGYYQVNGGVLLGGALYDSDAGIGRWDLYLNSTGVGAVIFKANYYANDSGGGGALSFSSQASDIFPAHVGDLVLMNIQAKGGAGGGPTDVFVQNLFCTYLSLSYVGKL